ncbi:MAG TPA: nucleoside-diphosphate sugar epimerase [Lachnoclostridium phytofermentans]|uniref:Nucleoside-diphosphate sugar epimerase n=1 Tax=Lachnoclostridium phytofermentans TaxID=66219 RepID=A0A3D2XA74_9FIRM|nr:nucleoside-diphosphate sugar epimerase/dehydratase [Lachnoclostridium sp.]HCL03258.1 nucleoside-diphosphate sugar epimerase [Lachnoclostridium phytofermentans]
MKKYIKDKQLFLRKMCLIFIDVGAVSLISILSLLIRYDFNYKNIDPKFLDTIWTYFPFNIITVILMFYFFRLYHSLWIFAGITELENIIAASIGVSALQVIGFILLKLPIPRSYFFIFPVLLIITTMASRFTYRAIRVKLRKRENGKSCENVMVIGAGEAANMIIKEIINSDHIHKIVKCIIDDAEDKLGRYIHGIKVIGNRDTIIDNVMKYEINEIIIAMPSVSRKEISKILEICKETDCKLYILPGMYQFLNGEVGVSELRGVEVEDLLGRDPIRVDLNSIMGYVKDKVVLITGGGGSIGSELCRQIAGHKPKKLIIVDIYENNAYDIQQELQKRYPDLDLVTLIASVRNEKRLDKIFDTYRPNIVYHAAAHKHVPLMEDSPNEAIKNNVFGTFKTVQAADKYGVEKFVLISSDKAVNPTNIMGATKRICEMIVQTFNRKSKTEFVAVRFGNVLGSNGSVIPLFKKQIEAGGPVTVTHPDIIRYFMTIPEAVSLVLQAGAYAKGGEIFVLDMGEPVKILDLATNLIRLSGYIPGVDIKIKFTGLRPGEKLFEELLMEEEGLGETENSQIFIGKPLKIDEEKFLLQLEELYPACNNETEYIREMVGEIVDTYSYNTKVKGEVAATAE